LVQSLVAGSLLAVLAEIPDPRGRHGRRHSLAAMLAAIVCAVLTGARGYRAIAEWVRNQDATVCRWLGFGRKPPCANSFRNLLLALPPETLEAALRVWVRGVLGEPAADELRATAIDGKTLCNTLSAHERNVQLLALLDQRTGGVLGQQAVDPTTNEAKAALGFLKELLLKGHLVSGDAAYCHRELCQEIIDSGGEYLFVVKDNQPDLKEAIAAEFRPGFSPGERSPAARLSV
jgi:hypothetical protein